MILRNIGFCLTEAYDFLTWKGKRGKDNICVKDIYSSLTRSQLSLSDHIFPLSLWKTGAPNKIIIFSWLVYHNKNLTWDNLQKRKWTGPGICLICKAEGENNYHMFLKCSFTLQLWRNLSSYFGFYERVT